jgi:hypothetical protein
VIRILWSAITRGADLNSNRFPLKVLTHVSSSLSSVVDIDFPPSKPHSILSSGESEIPHVNPRKYSFKAGCFLSERVQPPKKSLFYNIITSEIANPVVKAIDSTVSESISWLHGYSCGCFHAALGGGRGC